MDVDAKSEPRTPDDVAEAELVANYRAERNAAYRAGEAMEVGNLRGRVQQLAVMQQRFQRYLAGSLAVDQPGLQTMDHLGSVGSATPSELARKLGLSTAAMSLVLNRLEAAGHITRGHHPKDGRKVVVTASEETAERAYRLVVPMVERFDDLTGSFTDEQRATIETFLNGLITVYDPSSYPRSSD